MSEPTFAEHGEPEVHPDECGPPLEGTPRPPEEGSDVELPERAGDLLGASRDRSDTLAFAAKHAKTVRDGLRVR